MNPRDLSIPKWRVGAGLAALGVLVVAVVLMMTQLNSDFAESADPEIQDAQSAEPVPDRVVGEEPRFVEARRRMVEGQLRRRDISNAKVLGAMGRVPRHRFVPEELRDEAYTDHPLPIDRRQTISQPYIVALMTQVAGPTSKSRALEIGTGSGYQAAVLAELCKEVYSIEIHKSLADSASELLAELGYKNVTVRHGDGYQGWKEHAPFDLIVVTAAPDHVPKALVEQLAPGGRLVIPVGSYYQELVLIEKQKDGTVRRRSVAPVMFVPMTGKAQK